jgi:hypothetical protein
MRHNTIVTLAIGDHYRNILQISRPGIERYAERINADLHVITEKETAETTPHWEKFQILDFLGSYDRVLYVDADVLIRKSCPNLFDIVPETHLGVFNEAPFVDDRGYGIQKCAEDYNCKDFKWDRKYYNTGVMVVSRYHRSIFRKPEKEIFNFYEQSYINLQIQRLKPSIFELDYKFNRMSCMDKMTGKSRFESHIIHYAGLNAEANCLITMATDAKTIDVLPIDYESPKRIWLIVQGGLGDQIQAEPTIRFAIEKVWKGSDLRISTHFPEVFAHLPVVCKKHEEKIWESLDTEPFTRVTLPGPETLQWQVVSNLMSHTVDFCSMAVLCRILPDLEKTYRLQADSQSLKSVLGFCKNVDVSRCALVHPGRHWDSKTFPPQWWQEIVNGIIEKGITPIIIGKDDDTRGVVKLSYSKSSIDLTNLLSLKELIALISVVPVLVSNDSAPIHIL